MALITELKEGFKERTSVHDEIEAVYYILEGKTNTKVLQIDTFGRSSRAIPGKVSQSIQFSPSAIKQLKEILKYL